MAPEVLLRAAWEEMNIPCESLNQNKKKKCQFSGGSGDWHSFLKNVILSILLFK